MIIYSITNKVNGKKYIGQTTKPLKDRIRGHLLTAKHKASRKLYNAINKYGWHNFEVNIECIANSIQELNELETEYIIRFDTVRKGYNMGYGGDNNVMFYADTKLKHGRVMASEEVRKKISNTMKKLRADKGFSDITRSKISAKLKGNQNGKGKVRPISAILSTAIKHYKPVYCLDQNGKIITTFDSVKQAAYWWHSIDTNKLSKPSNYANYIKRSYTQNKYVRGFKWIYGKPCVETIETINKGVE